MLPKALNQVSQGTKNRIIPLGNDDYVANYKWLIHTIANNLLGPGQKYEFDEYNKPVFEAMLNYFLGRPGELDLNKGIGLMGNFGSGKSTIFEIFHRFLKTAFPFNENLFRITSIEEIISEMKSQNFLDSVYLYNLKDNESGVGVPNPIHILINEFGYKYDAKSYGTDVNEYVDMFLMKRYDIFQTYGKLVHITTNCDIDDMKQLFHERIIDRLKEMFKMIALKGNSRRK